jgi:hypothetical protein
MNILYTTAKEIDICESVPDNIWLHCGNNVKGECFNLNTTCFLDRNVICRYKWETLKFYNNKAIVHICKKNKDMCTVVKCGSNYPSTSPSTSPSTLSPSTSPSTSPKTLSPSTSPKTLSPSTSPKTLSPSTSPSTLSPSTSPKTLSPSTSPKTLSPSTSPSTLSPSTSPSTLSPSTSPKTLSPSTSPSTLSPSTLSPTLKENNNEEFLLFTLLIVPLLIACVTKPNVCVRWWRIISCWSRRHPTQEDNTEED